MTTQAYDDMTAVLETAYTWAVGAYVEHFEALIAAAGRIAALFVRSETYVTVRRRHTLVRRLHARRAIVLASMLSREVMEWNGRGAVRNGMATGIWLGVTVGIVAMALSGSSADDLVVGQPGSNGEALHEVEVADAVATSQGDLKSAGPRPMIRFKNANPRVSYGGIIERRMGTQGSYRKRIRHHGVYRSQHAQPDISGRIRYSGTGRLARYHTRGRIRYDGVTRAPDRARITTIRENWMGADRPYIRFGTAAASGRRAAPRTMGARHHWMGGYRDDSRFGVTAY